MGLIRSEQSGRWKGGVAAVSVLLDRAPVEVTRAVLAPGYVGLYLVEITVPKISNYGPAELYIDMNGVASNRVRVTDHAAAEDVQGRSR